MRARTHPPPRKPAPLPCPRNAAHSRSSFFAIHSRLPPAPLPDAQHFPATLPCPPLFRSLPAPRADFEPPSPELSPPFPLPTHAKGVPEGTPLCAVCHGAPRRFPASKRTDRAIAPLGSNSAPTPPAADFPSSYEDSLLSTLLPSRDTGASARDP